MHMLPVCGVFAGSNGRRSSSSSNCLFCKGMFLILHARFAYLRVLFVSSKSASQDEIQLIKMVRAVPPKLSCSSLVSLESLQDSMCDCRSRTTDNESRAVAKSALCQCRQLPQLPDNNLHLVALTCMEYAFWHLTCWENQASLPALPSGLLLPVGQIEQR